MVGPTLYLLQLVVELGLLLLLLIGLELLQSLVLLEGGDVLSQLVHESRRAMFDQVVDDYQHVEVFPCLLKVVLEYPDPLDYDFHDFLEGLEFEGEAGEVVEFGCGDYLVLALIDVVEKTLGRRALVS